ncbi:CMT1A duplicated region transcript 4 protein [Sorex araneus]|uniref:CMT1A duplicated region transcript 4 protein n=1 Tax=Sorex araneus TaxID=42254 RepID=UPI0024337CE5|nr:CMT1A duplicated region transcript 4 protein [Sorex araneus]
MANRCLDIRKLNENTGIPLNLLENHSPWPAYVTYTSPMVKRLIENSKARELQCRRTLEENQLLLRHKSFNIPPLKKRKSTKTSVNTLKDLRSKTALSMWDTSPVTVMAPPAIPKSSNFPMDSRDGPTANYNKIIFCRKPLMRMLPYSSLQASKKK